MSSLSKYTRRATEHGNTIQGLQHSNGGTTHIHSRCFVATFGTRHQVHIEKGRSLCFCFCFCCCLLLCLLQLNVCLCHRCCYCYSWLLLLLLSTRLNTNAFWRACPSQRCRQFNAGRQIRRREREREIESEWGDRDTATLDWQLAAVSATVCVSGWGKLLCMTTGCNVDFKHAPPECLNWLEDLISVAAADQATRWPAKRNTFGCQPLTN